MREPASGSRDGSPQFFGPPTRSPSPEQDPISSSLNEDASGTQDLARPHLTEDVSGTRDLARPHLTEDVPGQEDPLFDDVDDEDLPFFDVGDNDPNWTGDEDPPWMDEEGDFLDEEGDFLDDIDRDPGAFSFEIDLSLQYIKALKNASLENGELDQKTLDRLRNPPQYPLSKSLDKPTQISLDVFLSLSNFSQAAYNGVREVFMRNDPKVELLSYDRCKTLMAQLTGVIPVMQDMCMNSCHAFTGPLSDKEACVYCGAPRFENKGRKKVPVKQSTWFPIGTQLQAQCRSPEGAERMRHRDRRTDAILEELVANGGEIPVYDDVFHGSEYLEAVSQGKITSNTIVFVLSIDGAQLYRSKQSDCTIYIWVIYNLAPDIRYKKRYVLIGGIIPGPSSPKNIDSFIFSSLNHVAALQKEGLQVWDGSLEETILVTLFLLLITADTVGIKEFTGFVGHQGANSCRGFCPQKGRHVCGASTYYPAALRPHDSPHLPTNSAHPDIDISEFSLPDAARYRTLLKYVLESSSLREYKRRRLETGIVKPSIILGMPSSHRPLSVRCFTLDTMHLTALNIPHLLLALWSGQLKCSKHDSVDRWEFAVLRGDTWEQHGEVVVGMKPYLPGSFEDAPRNPAEKVNSGYKAWEFLIYMFVLGPAVFRGRAEKEPTLQIRASLGSGSP